MIDHRCGCNRVAFFADQDDIVVVAHENPDGFLDLSFENIHSPNDFRRVAELLEKKANDWEVAASLHEVITMRPTEIRAVMEEIEILRKADEIRAKERAAS